MARLAHSGRGEPHLDPVPAQSPCTVRNHSWQAGRVSSHPRPQRPSSPEALAAWRAERLDRLYELLLLAPLPGELPPAEAEPAEGVLELGRRRSGHASRKEAS